MERRVLLAVTLSILVLLSWSLLSSKMYPVANKEVMPEATAPVTALPQQPPPPPIEEKPSPQNLLQYNSEKLEITFIESQAAIQDIVFKDYHNYKFNLQNGLSITDNSLIFTKQSSDKESIVFEHTDANKRIEKKFTFSNSSYSIWLEIKIHNLSATSLNLNLPVRLGVLDFAPKNIQSRYQDVTVATPDKTLHLNARKDMEVRQAKFASLRDQYFCEIVQPSGDGYAAWIRKVNPQVSQVELTSGELLLSPGQEIVKKFHIYLGPQDLKLIDQIEPQWTAVVYYGTFDFIAQILLQLLAFLFKLVHNWGWAIIIFSLIVYIILYPLSLKQMRSVKEMQMLQPHIEELRKTYKDNQPRFNKEVMELYRKHKVNPFGGCLPIILQMPIFIALWQAFQRSILLKNASFLWIKDLSSADRLLILPNSWPIKELNILPILTAALMVLQQKMFTPASSSANAEQQKIMTMVMPLIFGFAFYNMPSGWVLYFLVNSLLMIVNQYRINKAK